MAALSRRWEPSLDSTDSRGVDITATRRGLSSGLALTEGGMIR